MPTRIDRGARSSTTVEPLDATGHPGAVRSPIKVLAIAGTGKNGATLFSRLLDRMPGFVAVGEIGKIWDRGLIVNQPCSCGAPFRDCGFWTAVGQEAFGGWSEFDARAAVLVRDGVNRRSFAAPSMLATDRYTQRAEFRAYSALMTALYGAILTVSGAEVIVDAHKRASHVWSVSKIPGFDVRAVHLVRDPRGVALSNLREVVGSHIEGDAPRGTRPPWRTAARWLLYNAEDELLAALGLRMVRMLYEPMVVDPGPRIVAAVTRMGMRPPDRLPFLREGEADLGPGHMLAGNRMRHGSGATRLRVDDDWSAALTPAQRRIVVAITLPLFAWYGYRSTDRGRSVARD